MPGLVWCAAPDGELNYLNRRILDYTGTSSEAWAQLGWRNLLHPDDAEATTQAWRRPSQRASRIKLNADSAVPTVSTDGFRCLVKPRATVRAQVVRWYGLLIDIEDRKNTEEALRKESDRRGCRGRSRRPRLGNLPPLSHMKSTSRWLQW